MPDVQVLVGQVERACGILLDGEVERLDTLAALAVCCIVGELQAGAAESVLLLENALIRDGDLDGCVVSSIEARGGLGELQDLRPGEVVALDVVGVEERVGGIEGRRSLG